MVVARPDTLRTANYISRISDEGNRRALEEEVIEERLTSRQVQQAVQYVVEEHLPAPEALARVTSPRQPAPTKATPTSTGQAAPAPARRRDSLVALLARANGALKSFSPEGMEQRELGDLIEELRQLAARATALIDELKGQPQGP
jgi:hypothetical protein